LVPLDGRFASSDLNDLYRPIIRNNRPFIENKAPEVTRVMKKNVAGSHDHFLITAVNPMR
jgi:DNA-directed RNA polymerase beta' subunit